MASRSYIAFIAIVTLAQNSYSSSPWLPEEDHDSFSISFQNRVNFSPESMEIAKKYNNIKLRIAHLILEKSINDSDNNIPLDLRHNRSELLEKKIESLKNKEAKYMKSFSSNGLFLFFEKRINNLHSMGFYGKSDHLQDFNNKKTSINGGGLFIKRKLIENNKTMFSGELGLDIENISPRNNISPYYGFNLGRVKNFRNERKLITEYIFKNNLDEKLNISFQFRNGLEFKSGIILQLSTFHSYNQNYKHDNKFFSKDEIVFSYKTSGEKIFPPNTIFSLSLYNDYIAENRIKIGSGLGMGIYMTF